MKAGKCFENLTHQVVSAISNNKKYKTIKLLTGDKNRLSGNSGCKHQIDIYWEHIRNEKIIKVIIECKDYGKPVSIGRVRDFFGVRHDIGDVEAWIVSSHGFQKGTELFAKYYGIQLKTLKWFENLQFESNVPEPCLIIKGFCINNKKYEVSAVSDFVMQSKFSSSDGQYIDIEFMQFISFLKSENNFDTKSESKSIKLSPKWKFVNKGNIVEFAKITVNYKFIFNSAAKITLSEPGAKLTHLDDDNHYTDEYFLTKKE